MSENMMQRRQDNKKGNLNVHDRNLAISAKMRSEAILDTIMAIEMKPGMDPSGPFVIKVGVTILHDLNCSLITSTCPSIGRIDDFAVKNKWNNYKG